MKMFRKRRFCLYMVVLLVIVVLASLYRSAKEDLTPPTVLSKPPAIHRPKLHEIVSHVARMVDSQVATSAGVKVWPNSVIVSDEYFLTSKNNSVKFLHTGVDLLDGKRVGRVLENLSTPYVILSWDTPKNIEFSGVKRLLRSLKRYKEHFLIVPFDGEVLQCLAVKFALKEWTVSFERIESEICESVAGKFTIFTRTDTLKKISDPWMLPFPDALFIQAAAAGMKTRILKTVKFDLGRRGDDSELLHHRYAMYDKLKMKKVVWDDRVEWYGCSRNTTRCFGTVFNDTPDFLYRGRWTPPCCLRVLRETARYVFRVLESHKIRYWLEGGSLLGAMRNGDIIPWDYDVDVGVYRQDLTRCPWIREIHKQIDKGVAFPQIEDKHGYVWELSRPDEGQFYRVQTSRLNRLHVDIFPFYPKNGIMTKDTWMTGHKQDREFPESFLKPLTKIPFAGVRVSAPNNIREFLELKFGPGCVENPEYPNPALIRFPKSPSATTSSPDDY